MRLEQVRAVAADIAKILGGDPSAPETLRAAEEFVQRLPSSDPSSSEANLVMSWLNETRALCGMTVEEIPISDIDGWATDPMTGHISHETGEFFRVVGIRVRGTGDREVGGWCQPILLQKEMGILGLLRTRDAEGRILYLLQAKAEPGNIGKVQLSPTLQSTVSNLRRAHGGSKSPFADLFERPDPNTLLYSRFQGEDGGRLHLKENLNMVVELPPERAMALRTPPNYRWISLRAIKEILWSRENAVNVSVRSILACL